MTHTIVNNNIQRYLVNLYYDGVFGIKPHCAIIEKVHRKVSLSLDDNPGIHMKILHGGNDLTIEKVSEVQYNIVAVLMNGSPAAILVLDKQTVYLY